MPRPGCNPYLTFAALLHAGLEGIEQAYELPEPMETKPLPPHAGAAPRARIVSLPETLASAVEELSGSELVRKALGPHIFDRYVELKRQEWDEYRVQLTSGSSGSTCRLVGGLEKREDRAQPGPRALRPAGSTDGPTGLRAAASLAQLVVV